MKLTFLSILVKQYIRVPFIRPLFVNCFAYCILDCHKDPLFVVVADSRCYRFDRKQHPPNLNLVFVISRGKTVEELYSDVVSTLRTVPSDRIISFKFCAGINNFLQKAYLGAKGSVFRPSNLSAEAFIESLANIKSKLKARFPNSKVAFGTIPPVHFGHLQESRLKSGLLKEVHFTADEIALFQDQTNAKLALVNCDIIELNKVERVWTLGLSEIIVKCHTKSSGRSNSKAKKVTSYHFERLYDGLHARSDIKQKWFNLIIKACVREKELSVKKPHTPKLSCKRDGASVCEKEEVCWKRAKRS